MEGTQDAGNPLHSEDLLERVARLESELAAQREALETLREQIAAHDVPPSGEYLLRPRLRSAAAPPPRPSPAPAPTPVPPAVHQAPFAFAETTPPADPAKPARSLENRIGSQLFNRIGILALLLGVAWFFKLAIDNHWIYPTPVSRTVTGLLLGAGIVLWSERFRRKGYPAFSYSLKAVGTGTLYLTLWAAFYLYHLLPAPVALILMIAVTAWNATMAWLQDAELLAAYALIGAFATPSLLGTGGNHAIFLFTYVLAANLAVLFLVAKKPWQRLLLGSFPATILYFIGWYTAHWSAQQARMTALFVILLSAPMVAVALIGSQREEVYEGVFAPLIAAAFLSLGLYSVLEDSGRNGWLPWLAVALAALYIGLMRLRRNGLAEAVHLSIAITFLTIAIPLKASGRWISIGWLAEAVALFWVAARVLADGPATASPNGTQPRVRTVIRWLASVALLLGVGGSLAFWAGEDANQAFLNARFLTELAAVAAVALTGWLARHAAVADAPPASLNTSIPTPKGNVKSAHAWSVLSHVTTIATHVLAALALARELAAYWSVGPAETNALRDQLTQLSIAAMLLLSGAALLTFAIRRVPSISTRRNLLCGQAFFYEAAGAAVMLFAPIFGTAFPTPVLWNHTAFFELIGLVCLAWSSVQAWRESRSARPAHDTWLRLAAAGVIAFNVLALLSGVHEILNYFALHADASSSLAESLTISVWLMLYAAALLTAGFLKRMAFIRWQGLILLVFTIGKVFAYDLRNLTSVYRILSILGLGILLMTVSFAYQKDWLSLREDPHENATETLEPAAKEPRL